MRALVTGGAGFIGSHVVDALVQDGHEVSVLDNLSTGRAENVNERVRLMVADVRSVDAVRAAVDEARPEAVFHFAAQVSVPVSIEDPVLDANVNIFGLLNLMSAFRALSLLPRVIFASSGGAVYGDARELPSSESALPNPATPYGVAKLAGEQYLALFASIWRFPTVILRFSNVYGPRQGSSKETGVCAVFVRQALEGVPLTVFGDGSQTRDYVYVSDVARASLLALTAATNDVVNVCSGVETSTRELASLVSRLPRVKVEVSYLPARLGDVERSWLSPEKASRVLRWSPEIGLEEGLNLTFSAR